MPVHPDPLDLDDDETDHSISLSFPCILELRDRLPKSPWGLIEMLRRVLHGMLSDEAGGAGSDFLRRVW